MHPRIIYNNRLLDAAKARAAAVSPVSLYGRGVFTTLAVYGGKPFLWPAHWMRLLDHAARARVDHSEFDEESVMAALMQLIEANHVKDGRARVTLLASGDGGVWKLKNPEGRKTELLIMTGEPHASSEEGIALTVSPFRLSTLSPLAGIKSINYLDVEFTAGAYAQLMQDRLLVFKPAIVSRLDSLALTGASRKHPVVLNSRAYTETVRVKLPEGFDVDELPDPLKLDTDFGNYNSTYEVKDGHLLFTRTLTQRAVTIPASQYQMVRTFYERIRAAELSPVVLARK